MNKKEKDFVTQANETVFMGCDKVRTCCESNSGCTRNVKIYMDGRKEYGPCDCRL